MQTNAAGGLRPQSIATLIAAALTALALLALVPASGLAKGAKGSDPEKGPPGSKFYKPPSKLPKGHGKLVWQRKDRGLTLIKGSSSSTLVLYTSKTINGDRAAVSGSVSVPKGKPPKGGWPVVSWAHGTTGTADSCAPTRIPVGGGDAPYVSYTDPEMQAWIKDGYAVLRTDYTGLGTPGPHGYLVGIDEGRAVLDIVGAARQLDPRIGKRYLIAGHSQGGHAALFAAGLAKRYDKSSKLRGTVALAPASHLADQAELLPSLTQPSPLTALATLIVGGASTVTDRIRIPQILSDPVLALYPQVDRVCLSELGQPDSLGGIAPSELLRKDASTAKLLEVLRRENPAVTSKAPILLAQGSADTTVFPFLTVQLDGELDDRGNKVDFEVLPGVGHGDLPAAAEDDTLSFFERRLPSGR